MVLDITLKQTAFEWPGSSVEKIEFWWCCFNCFFSYFKEETFRYFSAIEHIFACSSLTLNNSVCLSSYFHNFSKFYFIALPVRPPGVWSVSAPFVVGIYFFVKTLDSHWPWYTASLATKSVLLNHLNTSSAHLSALSWQLFKREVWKDKVPTLYQPLLRLGALLIYNKGFFTEKAMRFLIKIFSL